MKAFEPQYGTLFSHFYRRDENPALVLYRREIVTDQTPEFVRTVTLEPPFARVLAVSISPINFLEKRCVLELLKVHGYRAVTDDEWRDITVFARGWTWPVMKIGAVSGRVVWKAAKWAYRHHFVGVTRGFPEGMVVRLRDLRPLPFGFKVGQHV